MFCYQCQEAMKNTGCTGEKGICGVTADCINLQDTTVNLCKGLSLLNIEAEKFGNANSFVGKFITDVLFATITNANFTTEYFENAMKRGVQLRDELKETIRTAGGTLPAALERSICCSEGSFDECMQNGCNPDGRIDAPDEDTRSLRALMLYGLKGMAAYYHHAENLGKTNSEIQTFMQKILAAMTNDNLSLEENIALVMETGKHSVDVMALLDNANTSAYGNPEITEVNIGVRNNPGILISGHDLKDIEELLIQTEDTGVDVYTHGEMLPAQYYPAFKKYEHFAGNYGNAWFKQKSEFEKFNGPILMTTNCLVPPAASYKDRVFTTGVVGFDGLTHIAGRKEGGSKDFSSIIEMAKTCDPPTEIETGTIVGGFAHNQVLALADKVVDAVKSGAIKKFVVMAGCDGRQKGRGYYTDFAEALPQDSVILTAGCAKFRYNKLNLGDIGGIPRVLDAGQCNDSYSLVLIALKLKEVFELDDINDLPIVYNIAWYEQKAVTVLLALLYLGVKNIRLGPTLPAFLSPNVVDVLVKNFNIGGITNVEDDIKAMIG
ncbi:hydroxylamine reductase [bacterium]|nr:hydroxylamine reductase [bacterium]